MDTHVRILRDPRSSDDAVLRAAGEIAAGAAPAALWSDIGNDVSRRWFHRAVAVRELFKRHVTPPVTLERTAAFLDGGRWLRDAAVEKVVAMGGELPVRVPPGGAAFVIRLPKDLGTAHSEIGIYLALDRTVDAELLRAALTSGAGDPSVGGIRIVGVAVFPAVLAAVNDR